MITQGRLGKVSPETFASHIAPFLGAERAEVLAGPGSGRDAAIIKTGAGRVLAVTTDPLSYVPAFGPERSAWLACHLLASDLWTTGIPPAYVSVDFNLPPVMSDETFAAYWRAMSAEWAKLGVAVVTGHTGRYEGCGLTIIGGATLIGLGDEGRYLTPAMAAPGDRVVITKGAAIETAAVAGALFPERLGARLDVDALARLRALATQVSVVADCRAALRAGVRERGVTAMHDATEGGVLGGLVELAQACGHDLRIDRARIPLASEVRVACEVFGVDPWSTLAEGALLLTVKPAQAGAVIAALAEEHIVAAEIGEVVRGNARVWLTDETGAVTTHDAPPADPYWDAYARAIAEGWR
jgi:hydrogenase maturation factor